MMRIRRIPPLGSEPTVRVVVPCYNYGHYLPQCVRSILDQTGVRVEVLVIDDCSTDDSAEVARRLAAADPRVRVIVHERNRGHIATYNEGLASAESDYVVLLSADDLLAPGALQRATAIMERHPDVGLVYGNPQAFQSVPEVREPGPITASIWRGDAWIDAQFRRGLSIIYSPEAVVRTSVHHAVGWYRAQLPHSGDLEMWLRLAAASGVARVNGADQAYRRVHAASMMHTQFASVLGDLEQRQAAYESFLGGYDAAPARIRRLRRRMTARLAAEALAWACDVVQERGAGAGDARAVAAEALAFARRVDARALRSLPGRELLGRRRAPAAPPMGARLRRGVRGVRGRWAWQRWRHLGV